MKKCKNCGKLIPVKYRSKKYCSQNCCVAYLHRGYKEIKEPKILKLHNGMEVLNGCFGKTMFKDDVVGK